MARLRVFNGAIIRQIPFGAVFVSVMAIALAATSLQTGPADAAACPPSNHVMTNGFSDGPDFVNTVQGGDSSGHNDLAAIYAKFGLNPADYGDFATHAVTGIDKKNGEIWVGDYKVGTNGYSYGRMQSCQGSGAGSITAGGTTLWGNSNSKNFASDNLPVLVLFDETGTAKFIVIKSCGNPTKFKPVRSLFACDMLNKHPVDGKPDTYSFTTDAHAEGNAKIVKAVYDFGDGSPTVTTTDLTRPTEPHTFTQTSTITVTVFVKRLGSKELVPVTAETCKQVVTVTPPPAPTPPPPPPVPTSPAPKPTPPPELPKTGVGGAVGLFATVTTGGFLAHRQLLLRRKRPDVAVDKH